MKKKVCKQCKRFVDDVVCPNCKQNQFTQVWQGRIYILEPKRSEISKKLSIEMEGEYALKAR